MFGRAPGLAAAAIVTLALGIGANTAVFSVVHAVILQPLPYPDADRLVRVWSDNPRGIPRNSMSPADFFDIAEGTTTSFAGLAAYVPGDGFGVSFGGTGGGAPQRVLGTTVTAGLFGVLGVPPALGRVIAPEDTVGEGADVVLLSDRFWRRHFAADPAVVGRTLDADGTTLSIIGVMPEAFVFPDDETELWVPLADSWRGLTRSAHFLDVVGRVAPGVTLAQAAAHLDTASASLADQFPDTNEGWGTTSMSYYESVVGDARRPLLLLLAAVASVLLIACANVANLLFSGGIGRSREFAVRLASGASRSRLLRQMLVEGAALGLASGVAGLFVGWATLQAVLPAGSRRTRRFREVLLVAETALMVALLVGAGLLVRTLGSITRIDPGFR